MIPTLSQNTKAQYKQICTNFAWKHCEVKTPQSSNRYHAWIFPRHLWAFLRSERDLTKNLAFSVVSSKKNNEPTSISPIALFYLLSGLAHSVASLATKETFPFLTVFDYESVTSKFCIQQRNAFKVWTSTGEEAATEVYSCVTFADSARYFEGKEQIACVISRVVRVSSLTWQAHVLWLSAKKLRSEFSSVSHGHFPHIAHVLFVNMRNCSRGWGRGQRRDHHHLTVCLPSPLMSIFLPPPKKIQRLATGGGLLCT